MRNLGLRLIFTTTLAGVVACSSSAKRPPPVEATLGGDIVARVGSESIPATLVAKVAADQHITAKEALRRLIDDATCASAARAAKRDVEPPGSWLLTAARARWMADRFMADARRSGPPTDAEVEALSTLHWREVARPVAVHVVHALAMRPSKADDSEGIERARALGSELRAAVIEAKTAEEFERNARAVAHPPEVKVVVERLPAFVADGWITEGDGQMVEAFARAAHALTQPGDTSTLIETKFGWHVIRLLDRVPEQMMPLEAKRVAFAEEAIMERAHGASEERRKALRASHAVEVSPSAEVLMRTLNGTADRHEPTL